ncbi:MAG: S8 family serine peptidase [Saprospiraceae bacterium]|nr:S8 family serine peptidase [Saprospiraceae bacterium]
MQKTVQYKIQNQIQEIEYLDEAIALCLTDKYIDSQVDRDKIGKDLFAGNSAYGKNFDTGCVEAFKKSGWLFAETNDNIKAKIDIGELPEGAYLQGRLCRDADDTLKVALPRLTVQLNPDLELSQAETILVRENLSIEFRYKFSKNLFLVGLLPTDDVFTRSLQLEQGDEFVFAEPEIVEHVPYRDRPTDPVVTSQWQWKKISAHGAWDVTAGENVTVAVIDTGFDLRHLDLKDAFSNQSGFFEERLFRQPKFVQSKVKGPDVTETIRHGTRCAGMVAARANNATDGAGLAHGSKLTIISCLKDQLGSQSTLARAIAYACDPTNEIDDESPTNGADIIVCSLGPDGADWKMHSVLKRAIDNAVASGRNGLGSPVFWAVSNGNVPIDRDQVTSYNNVIAVGRSRQDDRHGKAAFGRGLDFLAPGVQIVTSRARGGTERQTGTSYSAPCAAGLGAMVLSVNPDLNWRQVREVIRSSCDKVGDESYVGGRNDLYGFGRINAAAAVGMASNITV